MADEKRKGDFIEGGPSQDGVDRRGFLKCMAWAGTGLYGHYPGVSRRPVFLGQRVTKHTMVIMDLASFKSAIATSASTRGRIRM